MTDNNDKNPNNKKNPFDSFGNSFPNDFFNNIRKIIEDMLQNSDFSDIEKFFEDQIGGSNPFVWGFSFNRGADGKPKFEQFGDFFKKMGFENGPVQEHERVREPLVDIIEEDTVLRIIVELPGVEKSQIDLSTKRKSVKIKAISDTRTYKKIIKLPVEVFPKSARAKFNNGVLEITIKRLEPSY